jgi:putative ABC transport system permease protein
MNLGNAFAVGLREIWAHKFRSVLTMAGIILGVASLVGMSALIQGMENGMREALVTIGGLQRITINRGSVPADQRHRSDEATGLTMNDVFALQQSAPLVTGVTPHIFVPNPTLSRGRKNFRPFWVTGVWPVYNEIYQYEVAHGRMFNEIDDEEARNVCVIGTGVRDQLWGKPSEAGRAIDPVGQTLTLNGQLFTVVGMFKHYESEEDRRKREQAALAPVVTETKKGPERRASNRSRGMSFIFDLKNTTLLLPVNTAWMKFRAAAMQNLVPDPRLDMISARVGDPADLEPALQQTRNILFTTHRGIEDYQMDTAEAWSEGIDSAIRTARLSGGIIAGISLIVGGIGIMNIMFASITERVREIGIRKAVGAGFRDIFTQVLVESVVIAIVGGLAGLLSSVAFVRMLASMSPMGNAPQITWSALALAFAFSVGVGALAGIFPAFKAARLNPIQALRYE